MDQLVNKYYTLQTQGSNNEDELPDDFEGPIEFGQ